MISVANIRRLTLALSLLVWALFISGCDLEPTFEKLGGRTMGTSWSLTYLPPNSDHNASALRAALEAELLDINQSMSTYIADSEINLVSSAPVNEPIKVSSGFAYVLDQALTLSRLSGGAYDVTVEPLILLWGFGPEFKKDDLPSEAEVETARAQVGYEALEFDSASRTLVKTSPRALDFSSIAKGFGVDRLADLLLSRGINNFMVEIGGDLVTAGHNPKGEAWRIGIERPDAASQTIEEIVDVSGLGMATSGDYRNYFEQDGIRYSHIIDAVTGRPITHGTASVTVLADTAMMADGWATALLALGQDRGLKIAETEGLAVLFIARRADSGETGFATTTSSQFSKLQAKQ